MDFAQKTNPFGQPKKPGDKVREKERQAFSSKLSMMKLEVRQKLKERKEREKECQKQPNDS